MRESLPILLLVALLFTVVCGAQGAPPLLESDWTFDGGAPAVGYPVPLLRGDVAAGLVVTLKSGEILVLGPRAERRAKMSLDEQAGCAAVLADLDGTGTPRILAADAYASIYCFDLHGRRLWKYARRSKASQFRHLICADLDGNGKRDVLFSDERGYTLRLNGQGKLLLEVKSNPYRASAPAVGDVDGDGKPEIVFGTEEHDVFCLRPDGEMVWSARVNNSVGRCLPVIGDVNRKGQKGVLVPTAFVGPNLGLYALSGRTGVELWKAPSRLQSYQSTAVADLEGNGSERILFGDKNTTLYCLDLAGKRLWATQIDGVGISVSPAIAWLTKSKRSLIFQMTHEGTNGKSLYVLDAAGAVVASYAVPGGGGEMPVLCRFRGRKELSLLFISGDGKLVCDRLSPSLGVVRVLWSGPGNSFGKAAEPTVASPVAGRDHTSRSRPTSASEGLTAHMGTNLLPVSKTAPDGLVCLRVQEPGGAVRVRLMHQGAGEQTPDYSFSASQCGTYDVSVRWISGKQHTIKERRFACTVPTDLSTDAAELKGFENAMRSFATAVPAQAELASYLRAAARAAWERAREAQAPLLFDAARRERETALALTTCCRKRHVGAAILVNQLSNPWPEFDAAHSLRQGAQSTTGVNVKMLGNAAESAAIAVTNLRPRPVTLRFVCGEFKSPAGATTPAKRVVQFREVLKVLPGMPLHPVEDPLPLLEARPKSRKLLVWSKGKRHRRVES